MVCIIVANDVFKLDTQQSIAEYLHLMARMLLFRFSDTITLLHNIISYNQLKQAILFSALISKQYSLFCGY